MDNSSKQKNQSVYSVKSIVIGSFFGGPLATLFMVYKNSVALNIRIPTIKFCLFALLTFLVYFAVLFVGSESYRAYQNTDISSMIFFGGIELAWFSSSIAVYSLIVWVFLDKKIINDFLKKGSKKRNFFGMILLVFISFAVMSFLNLCFGGFIYNIKTEHYSGTFYGFFDPGINIENYELIPVPTN